MVAPSHVSRVASPGLLSVGYEGMAAERLVAWLVAREVAVLADVRLNPISRKPGMSKTKLSSAIEAAGFRYMHVRALGNPSDNRLAFASDGEARRVMQNSPPNEC